MKVIVRPQAEADIQESSAWYEEQEPGLGGRFLDELGSSFSRARHLPHQFPDIGQGVHRALLRRFPYAIYFLLPDEHRLVVIAVLHQRRDSRAWKQRHLEEAKSR